VNSKREKSEYLLNELIEGGARPKGTIAAGTGGGLRGKNGTTHTNG
jgi:hypothetical protein